MVTLRKIRCSDGLPNRGRQTYIESPFGNLQIADAPAARLRLEVGGKFAFYPFGGEAGYHHFPFVAMSGAPAAGSGRIGSQPGYNCALGRGYAQGVRSRFRNALQDEY